MKKPIRPTNRRLKLAEKESLLCGIWGRYYWTRKTHAISGCISAGINIAEEELRVNPNNSYSYGVLAICRAMLGEKKLALDALGRAPALAGRSVLALQAALVYTNRAVE